MSKRFRAALPTGGRGWPRGGGARWGGGTPVASASDTRLAGALAVQRFGLVSSAICRLGGGQSQSSESSALPPTLLCDPRPYLEGVGGRRDACRGVWGCPGASAPAWKPVFGNPSWGASEEGCGAWRGSGVRAGTVPALLNAASRASRIAGALEGVLVLAEERWEGGRKGRLR